MKRYSTTSGLLLLLLLVAAGLLASAADFEFTRLPELPDIRKAKGLQIRCSPAKTNFVVGELVNLECVVTNTSDSPVVVLCNELGSSCFKIAEDEASWHTGVLPSSVRPQFLHDSNGTRKCDPSESIMILQPHASLDLLLSYGNGIRSAGRIKGIIVYDPALHGGGFFGKKQEEEAKQASVFSQPFEYEVMDAAKKTAKDGKPK